MQIKSYVVLVYNYMLINIYFLISILKYVRIKLKMKTIRFKIHSSKLKFSLEYGKKNL